MYLLTKVLSLSFSADFGENSILFHNSEYGFRVVMDVLALKPQMHAPITVGLVTPLLLCPELLCQRSIRSRLTKSLYIIVVAASGHTKEPAHNRDLVLCPVTADNLILKLRPHILSVSERKSRNNSFSILSRLFSYLYSCNVLAGLRPRCFGREGSFSQLCIAHLLIPYSRLNACWLSPPRIRCTTCSLSSIGYFSFLFYLT